MKALTIDVRFAPDDGRSTADRVRAVFGVALAGRLAPAYTSGDPAAEAKRLLDTEAIVAELSATRFAGEPITAEVARRADHGPVRVWCAVLAGLPSQGAISPGAWLRFALDLGSPKERLVPLAVAAIDRDTITIRFGLNGAPLLPPPPRDRGGPIDQRWSRAAEVSREELGRGLAKIVEQRAQVVVAGQGLAPADLELIAASWGAIEGLIIDRDLGPPEALSVRPSLAAGRCRACRHANQGTADLEQDDLLACAFAGSKHGQTDPRCDVRWDLEGQRWFAYEAYDGANSSWGWRGPIVIKLPNKKPAKPR